MGSAMVCAMVHNVNCQDKKDMKDWTDFMPVFEEKEPQSVEEMVEIAAMFTASMGGVDKRKKNVNNI